MSLMWKSLAQPWQLAFEMAWQAYKNGTIPIGAVVINETAVNLGEELQRKQYFEKAAVGQKQISEIYNELMTNYTF